MIYIFNRKEELTAILSNEQTDGCPIFEGFYEEILNGESTLEFSIPGNHEAAAKIEENGYAAIKKANGAYELFIIKEIEDIHENTHTKHVICLHCITELQNEFIESMTISNKNASEALTTILAGTRWNVGTVPSTTAKSLTITRENKLVALQEYAETYKLEFSYAFTFTQGKITSRTLNMHTERGTNTGRRITYGRDAQEITRNVNTRELVTALYAYGESTEVNGVETVVDLSGVEWSTAPVIKNLLTANQYSAETDLTGFSGAPTTGSTLYRDTSSAIHGSYSVAKQLTATTAQNITINTSGQRVAVEAGKSYTISVYTKISEAGKNQRLTMYWHRADGTYLGATAGTTFAGSTSWQQAKDTFTAPTGAATAYFDIIFYSASPNARIWADAFVFTEAELVVKNLLSPGVANPIKTGEGLRGWTDEGSTRDLISIDYPKELAAQIKSSYLIIQSEKTSPKLSILHDEDKTAIKDRHAYIGSAYVKSSVSTTVYANLRWYNSANKLVKENYRTFSAVKNVWQRVNVNALAPADAAYLVLEIYVKNAAKNQTLRWAAAQIEEGGINQLSPFIVTERAGNQRYNKPVGQTWIGSDVAKEYYGRLNADGSRRHIFGKVEFSEAKDSAELIEAAADYLDEYSTPAINYNIKAVDLALFLESNTPAFDIGDTVAVKDEDLNIYIRGRIVQYKQNLVNPQENEIILGDFIPAFTD